MEPVFYSSRELVLITAEAKGFQGLTLPRYYSPGCGLGWAWTQYRTFLVYHFLCIKSNARREVTGRGGQEPLEALILFLTASGR